MQQLDRIGRTRCKGRIRIDAPVVIAEDRVRWRAVVAARRKQIVEEEPVAIGVIQGVDLDFVRFGDAPESAPVVNQVAGHQHDVAPALEIYEPDFAIDPNTGAFACTLCMAVRD